MSHGPDETRGGLWIRLVPGEEQAEVQDGVRGADSVHLQPQVSVHAAVGSGDQ